MNSGGGNEHHSPSSTAGTVVSYFSIKLGENKNSEDCQLFTNTVNDQYNFKNLKDTPWLVRFVNIFSGKKRSSLVFRAMEFP